MKAKKHLDVRIPLWWPGLPGNLRAWLPSRGNVLFVVIVLGALMWAQSAGAFPSLAPMAAPTATSTGTIAYQGRLADAGGAPLTGTYTSYPARETPSVYSNPLELQEGSWETYQDQKFGFSVAIPPSWYVTPASLTGAGGATTFTSFKPGSLPLSDSVPNTEIKLDIGVATLDMPETGSLLAWVKDNQIASSRVLTERQNQAAYDVAELDVVAPNGLDARLWYFKQGGIVYFAMAMPLDSAYIEIARSVVNKLVFTWDRTALESAMATQPHPIPPQLAASSGYRLPFSGTEIVTTGPGCYSTHTGASAEAIDYGLAYETVSVDHRFTVLTLGGSIIEMTP